MELWIYWWNLIKQLRPACKRERTFLWMSVVLIGFIIRPDIMGVTSIIRAIGIMDCYYDRLLDFFHSPGLVIDALTKTWTGIVLRCFPLLEFKGHYVLIGDGIKAARSGKKMPAVKKLFQESESNTKPRYIFGHSCQAIAILAGRTVSMFAVPLLCRIHEGVKFTNRDKRSLVDKMVSMLLSLAVERPYYLVTDAYYTARQTIRGTRRRGNDLVSRVRMNAVAYYRARRAKKRGRGAPKKYGTKIRLRTLFNNEEKMQMALSPVYGEENVFLRYRCIDLLWRSAGQVVRFVAVIHPTKGKILLLSTDITLCAVDIIRLYGWRFKIEVSFKQALRTMGAFTYHFWMAEMRPIDRRGKNQYLHCSSEQYREKVKRKIDAYHRFIQLGLIAQGSIQYLSMCYSDLVWKRFGSWIRTIRPEVLPSEMVTSVSMKNNVAEFFASSKKDLKIVKFILERIDPKRAEGARLAA
jgi:hypothetical protein